jgi:hypothetical protein
MGYTPMAGEATEAMAWDPIAQMSSNNPAAALSPLAAGSG